MDTNLILFAIAIVNLVTAVMAWLTKVAVTETLAVAQKTELNTNSMREQLVLRTGEAEHARGREEARVEGEITAATLAKGIVMASSEPAKPEKQEQAKVPPLPVADERTATAAERSASATERVADAAESSKSKSEKGRS